MDITIWVLLGFAAWTIAVLLGTIGYYRWSRILTGRDQISHFQADHAGGSDWYRRAIRAHANCLESLPIYTAIVVAIMASGKAGPLLDGLAITMLAARICQTIVHITCSPTNLATGVRFSFFAIQLICMIWMGVMVATFAG